MATEAAAEAAGDKTAGREARGDETTGSEGPGGRQRRGGGLGLGLGGDEQSDREKKGLHTRFAQASSAPGDLETNTKQERGTRKINAPYCRSGSVRRY